MLFGFGMRNAIASGYMAAQSILQGTDYEAAARNQFAPKVRASLVNRFLWETLFKINNYGFVVKHAGSDTSTMRLARNLHNFNMIQKILYPFARLYMRRRYPKLRI